MYLTPAQFRRMGYGSKVADLTDAELAAVLMRASSAVDSHCAVPTIPQKHDFRGGSIVGETHTWRVDLYDTMPTRRVFLYHRPVLAASSMRIYATAQQYLEIPASELYYESSEGWIEPASSGLTGYGLFGATVLPFVGFQQPHVVVNYTYGRRETVTERAYYGESGNTWVASRGSWIGAPEVRVNGVLRNAADYTVDATEGSVTFVANVPDGDDAVTVTYTSSLPYDIAEATGIIAASLLSEQALVSQGLGGVRAFRVAEVSVERSYRSEGAAAALEIPLEAAAKLEGYIFRSVR